MIKSVSTISFGEKSNLKQVGKKIASPFKNPYVKQYSDCFIKHSKESAPMLLGLTALWAALDYGTGKVSVSKSIKNNLKSFFLPVLLVSSAFLATVETQKNLQK